MVPDKFNMVDMDGIDLIMMQGEEVPGLYNRLVESIAQCRYQCLYNWMFDGVIIPPTYVEMEVGLNEEVRINEGVVVTSDDVIHIHSIEPPPPDPHIIPLLAEENDVYEVPSGVDGFNPVTVDVPSYTPVIDPISITENGTYTAGSGVDGYSPVTVNILGYISPDYQGLQYSYIANNGWYYSNVNSSYYCGFFHVLANKTYAIFSGSAAGNRNRCHFYANKNISDFEEYISSSHAATQIYQSTTNISGEYDIDTSIRFLFTPSVDGEIIIMTSNTGQIAPAYCVELP